MNCPKNVDEVAAQQALKTLGFESIVFEPDGNVPPDFVVDGQIAVEVRRLNENDLVNGKLRGREEQRIPLQASVVKLLRKYGPRKNVLGRWLFLDFNNDRASNNDVVSTIKELIDSEKIYEFSDSADLEICKGVTIRILKSESLETEFELGGCNGEAIWVKGELLRNSNLCVSEKTKKIKPHKSKYCFWWLVLVDYVSLADAEMLKGVFQEEIDGQLFWDKIFYLSPLQNNEIIEIRRHKLTLKCR